MINLINESLKFQVNLQKLEDRWRLLFLFTKIGGKMTASSISPYYSFLIFLILFVPTATWKIYLKF